MRERDVPQEGNATLAGNRKAVYAVAEDGRLRIVASRGWEAEEIVTRQAVEDLERRAQAARARVLAGQASPLEYHMYKARMDLPLSLRRRYSEALGVPLEQLDKVE